jgi:FkbM family methyltransferase
MLKSTFRELVHSARFLNPDVRYRLRGLLESGGSEEVLSVCLDGGLRVFYPSRSIVGLRMAEYGYWKPSPFSTLCEKYLANAGGIIEVGGNIGLDTLLMASKVQSQCPIVVFEPVDKYRAILEMNIKANNITNVHVRNTFVSARSGVKIELNITSSSASAVESTAPSFPTLAKQGSQTIAIDDYMQNSGVLTTLDFLKVDTDGWDQYVVEGASRTIGQYMPFLYVEFSGYNLKLAGKSNESFAELLGDLGYRDFFLITHKEPSGKRVTGYRNLVENLDENSSSDVFAFRPKHN